MQCPVHKENLRRVQRGISYVCPRCEYKVYDKSKYWLPEIRFTIELPSAFDWSLWSLNGLEANGDNALVLSTGVTIGVAISPQMINLTRQTKYQYKCTKVIPTWVHTLNDGKIEYLASNDGGTTYSRWLKTQEAIHRLNDGSEPRQYKQTKYTDLRIKITLTRNSASDTTPSVSELTLKYNKVK